MLLLNHLETLKLYRQTDGQKDGQTNGQTDTSELPISSFRFGEIAHTSTSTSTHITHQTSTHINTHQHTSTCSHLTTPNCKIFTHQVWLHLWFSSKLTFITHAIPIKRSIELEGRSINKHSRMTELKPSKHLYYLTGRPRAICGQR